MKKAIRKYQNGIAALLIASYLVGGFQMPLLECIHFASHIDDLVFGDFQKHNFHSHSGSHNHRVLDVLEQSDGEVPVHGVPTGGGGELDLKKSPQLFTASAACWSFFQEIPEGRFFVLPLHSANWASVPAPPPKA